MSTISRYRLFCADLRLAARRLSFLSSSLARGAFEILARVILSNGCGINTEQMQKRSERNGADVGVRRSPFASCWVDFCEVADGKYLLKSSFNTDWVEVEVNFKKQQ
mmetsp:Transcript_12662/g.29393  ORF Transcript_12662/g.29393 Transcript_12662/m.29393 type:complete len:107 (+) Transcript_12662:1624-1944(+)